MNNKMILVIDDNRITRAATIFLLESMGCRVVAAGSGHAGIAIVKQENVDVILMDIDMPEMDGFQCSREIRQLTNCSNSRVPIIAFTASNLPDIADYCVRFGINDYIEKTASAEELGHLLKKWFMAAELCICNGIVNAEGCGCPK
jgi:CheY-like chemotaxis protein